MKRLSLFAVVLLSAPGCLSPITGRLDRMNDQLTAVNAKLDETNRQLDQIEHRLEESIRRINSLDQSMKRLAGMEEAP